MARSRRGVLIALGALVVAAGIVVAVVGYQRLGSSEVEGKLGGYRLLDSQFLTDHLASFGAIEVNRHKYGRILDDALANGEGDFYFFPPDAVIAGGVVLQSVTQTS